MNGYAGYWKRCKLSDLETITVGATVLYKQTRIRAFWNAVPLEKLEHTIPTLQHAVQEALGTRVFSAAVLFMYPNQTMTGLHTDHTQGERGLACRLNIPIIGCSNSVTTFYDVEGALPEVVGKNGTTHWGWSRKFKTVTRMTLSEPTVLNVQEPHGVLNFCKTGPRVALTLSLEKDISAFLA